MNDLEEELFSRMKNINKNKAYLFLKCKLTELESYDPDSKCYEVSGPEGNLHILASRLSKVLISQLLGDIIGKQVKLKYMAIRKTEEHGIAS